MRCLRPQGLYCLAGNFYIDPKRAVGHAVETHAHSDHARRGSALILSTYRWNKSDEIQNSGLRFRFASTSKGAALKPIQVSAQGATTGIEIHRQLQLARASANDNYSSEVSIESRFQSDGFEFEVSGRIDGLYKATAEARPHIEEIKSSFNMFELLRRLKTSQDEHPVLPATAYVRLFLLVTRKNHSKAHSAFGFITKPRID